MKKRNIYIRTWEELSCEKNMIFLTGPRQAGKTTLARMISDSYANQLYFNWDIPEDQIRLVQNPSFFESVKRRDSTAPLIILDEIHKYRHWKNYLKGVCDKFHDTYKFLVSGSGRLDIYQKGGDSLAGRYLLFHLWPFTIAELGNRNLQIEQFLKNPLQISMKGITELQSIWNRLAKVSGFPEPYLAGRITTYRRWSNTYSRQLIHEDIRDLTGVKSIKDMETLYYLLPSRTGSTISIPSLSRDLKVSYNSVNSKRKKGLLVGFSPNRRSGRTV
jgi:predicted AAA+ superfamily ATPase